MKLVALKVGLGIAVLAGVAAGARVAAWPIVGADVPDRTEAPSPDAVSARAAIPESIGDTLVARDPFRLARRPAAVAYDPIRVGQPMAPAPPKPLLALDGIVWDGGRDPTALIDGLPGTDGPRVVRRGESVGPLRVKRIGKNLVEIVGLDTVWTVVLKEPWR